MHTNGVGCVRIRALSIQISQSSGRVVASGVAMVVCSSRTAAVGGRKFSTVVPATVTGEKAVHLLSNMDLAMKLHYVRGVYYFRGSAGLGTRALKEPMFSLLEQHSQVSARIRRSDDGRPFLKCNDSGVRIVEATCADLTLDEWLQQIDRDDSHLVPPDHFLGPDLHFSPLVLIQFTWFKGGGFAFGLSWSHLLGDTASAVSFMNQYGRILGGKHSADGSPPSLPVETPNGTEETSPVHRRCKPPLSVKHVEHTMDDCWVAANQQKMESLSFHVPEAKLSQLLVQANTCRCSTDGRRQQPFETLCALVCHCISKASGGDKGPRTVTVCRPAAAAPTDHEYDDDDDNKEHFIIRSTLTMSNKSRKITTVVVDDSPSEMELGELARVIGDGSRRNMDESLGIEEEMEDSGGSAAVILYGANLTLVDLEGTDPYGLQVMGQRPVLVDYSMDGVGDEGTLLVLPDDHEEGGGGRVLNLVLPQQQLLRVRQELATAWGLNPINVA